MKEEQGNRRGCGTTKNIENEGGKVRRFTGEFWCLYRSPRQHQCCGGLFADQVVEVQQHLHGQNGRVTPDLIADQLGAQL
jgi:hypothetical protein